MKEKVTDIYSLSNICLKSPSFGGRLKLKIVVKYSITCIKRPPKGRNKHGLLQQVVLKCRIH